MQAFLALAYPEPAGRACRAGLIVSLGVASVSRANRVCMIPSTVTDEVSPERTPTAFPKILETATADGITNVKVRMVHEEEVPVIDPDAWDRPRD